MQPNQLPPSVVLQQMLSGMTVTASLSALAKLGVADHMHSEPVSAEYLAEKTSAHAPSLYRVMRMAASLGVFEELPGRLFTLTPVGRCLRSDVPDSVRDLAIIMSDGWETRSHENMLHVLRTGRDGVTAAYGKNVFEVFQEDPEQARNFNRCMTGISSAEIGALDPVMDFSGFRRIADVGGGHGMLLGHILRKHPNLHGVLFDLPSVVGGASAAGHFHGCGGRITFEPGSMFEHVPAACDAYLLKHILHDWDDAHNHKILRLICEQLAVHARENGRVLIAEMIVPHSPGPSPAKMLDITMLLTTIGGKERTVPEFSALFEDAGLELVGVKLTQSPMALIEARVAQ